MFLCPANVVFICETPTNSLKKNAKKQNILPSLPKPPNF